MSNVQLRCSFVLGGILIKMRRLIGGMYMIVIVMILFIAHSFRIWNPEGIKVSRRFIPGKISCIINGYNFLPCSGLVNRVKTG